MNNIPTPTIPLTPGEDGIQYRKCPTNPVFECTLHPGMIQQLGTDAATLLATPKKPKDFWLRLLLDMVLDRGHFVFTTSLPKQDGDPQSKVAARTLFQLDGDVLLKINKSLLKSADGINILEAHFGWTEWCLKELGRALSLPRILRYFGWVILVLGLAASVSGLIIAPKPEAVRAGFTLQQCGLATLMLGHLLLPPTTLDYFRWFPVLLGTCWTGLVLLEQVPGAAKIGFFDFFPIILGLVSGFAGGHLLRPLARKVTNFIIKERMARALSE